LDKLSRCRWLHLVHIQNRATVCFRKFLYYSDNLACDFQACLVNLLHKWTFLSCFYCFLILRILAVNIIDSWTHTFVALKPLRFRKYFDCNDIPVECSVLVQQTLDKNILQKTLNVYGGLVKCKSGNVESSLEVSSFFHSQQNFTQLKVSLEPERRFGFCYIAHHLHII